MAGALPEGSEWPADHKLDLSSTTNTFHAYVHIPFCEVRCGYCDFNTYTASEIGDVRRDDFHLALVREMQFSKSLFELNKYSPKKLSSIFFGGGTPTLISANAFAELIGELDALFGVESDAEITTEANPDNISPEFLSELVKAGINRISFGVQSFDSQVLKTLDRTHDPIRVPQVIEWAKAAGLRVSVDLIFGAPGESMASWKQTVQNAIDLDVEHISAYSLIVEPGTKLERQIRSGQLEPVDDDLLADKYELACEMFESASLSWYEISNWGKPSIHNQAYWNSMDWWGYGPGAHSHIAGTRWWNRKHPVAYRSALQEGSPAQAFEKLAPVTVAQERLLLELRTAAGVDLEVIRELGISTEEVTKVIAQGLIQPLPGGRIGVTKAGRLLADGIVLGLLGSLQA